MIDVCVVAVADKFDDITGNITIGEYNYTDKSIKVGWKEPENPNGLIIKYYLEYQRMDSNVSDCIHLFHLAMMTSSITVSLFFFFFLFSLLLMLLLLMLLLLLLPRLQSNVKKECVRRKDFLAANRTKTLMDLSPGDYWIQIRAQSLAKLGNPSDKEYFSIDVN